MRGQPCRRAARSVLAGASAASADATRAIQSCSSVLILLDMLNGMTALLGED